MLLRMTPKSGSGQACAACKFQRRRCTPQCLLAPFFPADQPQMFQNVHRLFGVKHIQKLLKELHPDQRAMAIKSIKFHATMRDKYPVYGCIGEIHNLNYQIQLAEQELHAVLQQLIYYRQQHHQQDDHGDYDNKDGNDHVDSLWMQQTYSYGNNNNVNSVVMQTQLTTTQETSQDYNEMHSFFDNIDDRQSYIGPKEVYESSLESSLRDSRQCDEEMAENELKNAAACFSLTSFN